MWALLVSIAELVRTPPVYGFLSVINIGVFVVCLTFNDWWGAVGIFCAQVLITVPWEKIG